MSINNYYVGWTGTQYRTDLMPEPVAPANYRDPVKIAAYVDEQRAQRMHDAAQTPFFGRLARLVVVNEAGETVVDVDESASFEFVKFLTENFQFPNPGEYYLQGAEGPAQLVGFNLKVALKIAALEVLAANRQVRRQAAADAESPASALVSALMSVPVRMWHYRTYCSDPVSMLKTVIPGVDMPVIANFFDLTQFDLNDPAAQAVFVRDLSQVIELGGGVGHLGGAPACPAESGVCPPRTPSIPATALQEM
jgi:hypothetical protein